MKKWLFLTLLIAVLLVGLLLWSRPGALPVSLVRLETGEVLTTVVNTRAGSIRSCQRADLSLPMGGVVTDIRVQAGDSVKRGQLLLRLWDEELQAERQQALASQALDRLTREQACLQADFQQREAERLASLLPRNLTSRSSVDQARTQARSARLACHITDQQLQVGDARLGIIDARLAQTRLLAPFDGVIAEVNSKLGEYMTPSPPGVSMPPVIDLIDRACLYVSAPIDEVDAARLRVGQPAFILLDALPDQRFPAHLTRVAPYVQEQEKQARTVEVEARFDAPPADVPLLIGYSADLEIEVARAEAVLRLPTEALREDGQVLRYRDGQLELIRPELGLQSWSWAEVKAGLVQGDRLVQQPGSLTYEPGMRVEPAGAGRTPAP